MLAKPDLGTSLSLLKKYAWAFPAFKRPKDMSADLGNDFESLTPDEQDALDSTRIDTGWPLMRIWPAS